MHTFVQVNKANGGGQNKVRSVEEDQVPQAESDG